MIKNIKHLFLIVAFLYAGMLHAQTTDLIYHLGSSGSTINVSSVATDANGNIFICGSAFGSSIDFNPLGTATLKNAASGSGFIAKYNINGILQTVIVFGANTNNKGVKVYVDPVKKNVYLLASIYGNGIKLDPNATGFGTNGLAGSMAIAKYDNALGFKSQKIFNNGTGNTGDVLNDISVYGADLYVTGTLFSTVAVEFNPGGTSKQIACSGVSDIIVAKYDTTTLTNVWAYGIGGTDSDAGLGIDIDNSGNMYMTGYFTGQNIDIDPIGTKSVSDASTISSTDAFVAKYNTSSAACQWAFNIGAGLTDRGDDILVDPTGTYLYVGGIVKNDALDVDFDPSTTNAVNFAGVGLNDLFVASYFTSDGSYNWNLATGSTGEDELTSLAFDTGGNIVLSGFTSGNVNFGNSKTITGLGGKDAYFAVLSGTSGLATAAYNLGGASDEQANGVAVGSSGKILVVGSYTGAGDYNLGIAATLPISGTQDGFVSRHVLCTPPTITGTLSTCIGSTTQLTGSGTAAASSPWVSAISSVATVSNTGLVTGVGAGTSVITYTNNVGCAQTATVTIIAAPTITGTLSACAGLTTQLTGSGTPDGTTPWASATTSVATVSNTGLITGVGAGTSVITYKNSVGCTQTATLTITSSPNITGTLSACIGLTTQLTGSGTPDATTPWASATTSVATVSNTGLVTGVGAGTSVITYKNSVGCTQTATVTVTAAPSISGTLSVCVGLTTQLTGSGTAAASSPWVSATTSVATVSNTGLLTGVAAGTSVITYKNSAGCTQTATVTVTAAPTITGILSACIGSTTQLTGSGTAASSSPWVSATPSVATVSNTGLVTGVAAGTSIITYTNSVGCTQTTTVTINTLPTITGTLSACVGLTTQLAGSGIAAASNPWVSATPSVATISNTGLVTGVSAGTSIITYTNSNGCTQTTTVTINALPAITGTLSVCVGFTTQLTGSGTAAASTPWVSATSSVATVSNTGLVTGVAIGTSVITYTNSNGCIKTATVTVTSSVVPTVSISSSGGTTICAGASITLTANPTNGGTPAYKWKLGSAYISGATNVTYTTTGAANNDSYSVEMTSSSSCASPSIVTSTPVVITVNPTLVPSVTISTVSNTICLGDVITFTSTSVNPGTAPSYVWRKNGVAITPAATGTSYSTTSAANADIYSVAITSNELCASPSSDVSNNISVAVNVLPTITGTTTVCEGATIALNGSGTANASNPWVSATPSVATVSNTGVVTGISAGTSIITYTNATGCSQTVTVTVNAAPTVTGTLVMCIGATTQLTGSGTAASSNPWISSSSSKATVDNTGLVTAIAAGTSVITYTTNTGCSKTVTVTVNSLPTITGASTVCTGFTTQLTGSGTADDTSPWASATTSVATVNSSGLVTGVAGGTSVITYKNSNGCTITQTVTVNPATAPGVSITANNSIICAGTSITFTATPTDGGTSPIYQWEKGGTAISGATNSTYTTTAAANGDSYSVEMTSNAICASTLVVNSNPIVITVTTSVTPTVTISANPGNTICTGTSVTFTATPGNGGTAPTYQWKKNGVSISAATNITYTTSTLTNGDQISVDIVSNSSCASTLNASSSPITMVVTPIVSAIVTIATPSTTVCAGTAVLFTASYTNEGATPLFEWFVNSISQGTPGSSDTYTSSTLANGDQVSVKMTSSLTCVTTATVASNSITITVTPNVTPTVSITSDKSTICAGGTVTYTATPVNGGTASYQWKVDGTNSGSASALNTFAISSLTDGNTVTVVLTSSITCVTSPTATSNGLAITVAPETQIGSQPSDQSVCALGNNVTFSVGATGDNLTYQWKAGSTNLANNSTYSGVATKDLSISNVSNADLLGYSVTVTGTCGTLTSNVATLTQSTSSINITAQPVTQVLEVGDMIQLSVSATGPTLSYQWKKNGIDLVNDSRISGANTSSLQISNALVSDSDNNYTCLIMSPCAAQLSTNATVVTVTNATSTQDALTKGFMIAPNPSAGHFTLSNNSSPFIVEEIEIISMEGIVVARKAIVGTTNLNEEIFAQDLPKGMYLLVIKGEGEQALLKIVFDK